MHAPGRSHLLVWIFLSPVFCDLLARRDPHVWLLLDVFHKALECYYPSRLPEQTIMHIDTHQFRVTLGTLVVQQVEISFQQVKPVLRSANSCPIRDYKPVIIICPDDRSGQSVLEAEH